MTIDITVTIGGEAGQGIQTVGDLLALVGRKAGLYIMAINDFESRIRGGHSFFQIRLSDRPVNAPHHKVNLLVALNAETYALHREELVPDGLVLADETADKTIDAGTANILSIPWTELAKKAGGRITSNTVAAGAALAVLGAPFEIFRKVLSEYFGQKGKEVFEKNVKAAELGYQAVKDVSVKGAFQWKEQTPKGALINGSKAIALGALCGDCRMGAFYPMSPATGIMTQLAAFSEKFPLVVEQAEDEIAAVNMVIGASFAGIRAMTATSGGGFSLMAEGLGLAGISETPIVIVDAQRPGPATGLPTRTGQADLLFVIRASQDEFPRFVFAPGSPTEAFETMARAFHLSEKYQVPVIVLVDQYLVDSFFIVEKLWTAPKNIERFIASDAGMEDPAQYRRFALTSNGVSPRAIPCRGKALVVISSDEHREDGHISETISDRVNMVNKRNAKVPDMLGEMAPPDAYRQECEVLLVGWGSTKGAVKEAVDLLRADGINAGCLHFKDLWPFPSDAAASALKKAKKFLMVEQNSTAQLGRLIREQTGLLFSGTVLKYDGRPFNPFEIADGAKKFMR